MPLYAYITQSAKGAPFSKATADAPSLSDLNARLFHLNKPVVKILERRRSDDKKSKGIPLRFRLTFLEQLEASCHLGMDLRTALGICLENTSRRTSAGRQLAGVIRELRNKVMRGVSFARAICDFPYVFDEVSVGLIAAGEEGGTFNESLTNVCKIWARNEDLHHRLLMMLIYPAIVLAAAIGVVWLLMTRVVPQFVAVLSQMNVDLPVPTRILIAISGFWTGYPWIILLCGIAVILLILKFPALIRRTPVLHAMVLRVPLFGQLTLLLVRANFTRTFAQLKNARAKTTQCLVLCRDLSWNYEYRSAVARTLLKVQRGEPLSRALEEDVDIFGDMVVHGLAFMEVSGSGSEGLIRLTDLLERQLDAYINAIRQVLDPLLVLFLGGVIGGIVFATFLPAIEILRRI
jgi:type II secretory pathway component PulF